MRTAQTLHASLPIWDQTDKRRKFIEQHHKVRRFRGFGSRDLHQARLLLRGHSFVVETFCASRSKSECVQNCTRLNGLRPLDPSLMVCDEGLEGLCEHGLQSEPHSFLRCFRPAHLDCLHSLSQYWLHLLEANDWAK